MPAILGIIVAIILFVVLLKLVFALLGLAIAIGFGVIVYFFAEKLVGKGA